MFTVYKKITTQESSPVLGPATSPAITSINATTAINEPFSLYNCCCIARGSDKTKRDALTQEDPPQTPSNSNVKYEFGHATHYIYNATTPRMICEFETGTPADP